MGSYEQSRISIIITGGGIAGLILLRGLLKHPHLDPVVYEATAAYGDVGGGMALHKNAILAMQSVDADVLQAYLRKANSMLADDEVEMSTQVILGEGPLQGNTVAHLGRAKGRKTVSRHDLIEGLRSIVDESCIHFSKRLKSVQEVDQQVVAEFEDGSTATADCLIGADGIHSAVRTHLLGDHPATNPVNHDQWARLNIAVPYEVGKQSIPEKWLGFVPIICGSKGYFNMMPIHHGKTMSCALVFHGPPTREIINQVLDVRGWSSYDPDILGVIKVSVASSTVRM
jgi:salicylate hydroxylase